VVTLTDVNFLAAPGTYEPAMVRYLTRVFHHAVINADALTTISEHSRVDLVNHFDIAPDRISVVYPGVTPPPSLAPSNRPNSGRPYALYVGATEFHKNIDTLLKAWRADAPAGLDLVLVGQPGRAHKSIEERAQGAAGRVALIGAVDQTDLEGWYAHAEVFLFPSLAEGFGYPPLEAMLRGVPVIASRAGSLPEVLEDAALFHEPRNAEEVRQMVIDVVADPKLSKRLIDLGRARAAYFTWDRAAEGMDVAIGRAIAAHH
jgi:glycosyltransferase involved in cell wall biosynthesis